MSDRKLVIPLIFGIIFVVGFIPDSFAANHILFVSAENSQFNNYMSGPQVIMVVVIDSDISDTTVVKGEPDVTVNGKILRMVQGVDGNWYGFFADIVQAGFADSTSDDIGIGLDFGEICSSADAATSISETGDPSFFEDASSVATNADVCGSTTFDSTDINVLREARALNEFFGFPQNGQIGVKPGSWPFIQLYNLSIGGNVVVQYNKGGGAQTTTLTFDTVEAFAGIELDRAVYPQGSEVHATITDLWLNIDPTDEDSWTFGTGGTSTNYQVFDEHGNVVGDTPSNTDSDLTDALGNLMCEDNCILLINTDVIGDGAVLTLQDNDDSEIRPTNPAEDGNPQNPASWETIGGNISGDFPVTITEQGPRSGVFAITDESDNSNIVITDSAKRGHYATIDYNEIPQTILVGFSSGNITIDVPDGEWNTGEEVPVTLVDGDADKNSRADEDLDLFKPRVLIIPSLTTGDPFTLSENDDTDGALLDITIVGTGEVTTIAVDKFSKRAILSATNSADTVTGIVIDLDATAADLQESINDPQANFSGFNFFNLDVRSFTSGNVDVDILANSGDVSVADNVGAQSFTNLKGIVENNLNAINPADSISLEITFLTPIATSDLGPKEAFVADFFSFGFFDDGLTSPERVANQIIRLELEETGDSTSTFEGSLEYTMVNQLNILDAATYEGLSTISDNPTFIVIEDLANSAAPQVDYLDLDVAGNPVHESDQEDAPSHSGTVSFDAASYIIGETVTVTLEDSDLNENPEFLDVYTWVDPSTFPTDPARDTIGKPGLGVYESAPFGAFGRLLDITFDGDRWTSGLTENGGACGEAGSPVDGLTASGFSLVETGIDTGIFVGNFEVPETFCQTSSNTIKYVFDTVMDMNYIDFRDTTGDIVALSDTAGMPSIAICEREASEFDNVIIGTNGNEKLKGTNLDDLILGFDGKDNLTGMKGNDCLIGGLGNDKMNGGQGTDICLTDAEDNSSPVQCEG